MTLEREFKYYLDHQKELAEKFNLKTLVIVGEAVVDVYENELSAYQESLKKYALGTFLIQKCTHGDEYTTQTFNSRVIFT